MWHFGASLAVKASDRGRMSDGPDVVHESVPACSLAGTARTTHLHDAAGRLTDVVNRRYDGTDH